MRSPTPDEVEQWIAIAPNLRDEIDAVHERMAQATQQLNPVCTMSGRCCDFERFGHDLFVSGLETAVCLTQLPGGIGFDQERIDAAVARGGCPFQILKACAVHSIRPSGCRSFFCDSSVDESMFEIAERAQRSIREIHSVNGVPYLYSEWRRMLAGFAGSGFTQPGQANAPELVQLRVGIPSGRAT